jgi:hypothetical protein
VRSGPHPKLPFGRSALKPVACPWHGFRQYVHPVPISAISVIHSRSWRLPFPSTGVSAHGRPTQFISYDLVSHIAFGSRSFRTSPENCNPIIQLTIYIARVDWGTSPSWTRGNSLAAVEQRQRCHSYIDVCSNTCTSFLLHLFLLVTVMSPT